MIDNLNYSYVYSYRDGIINNAIKFLDVNLTLYLMTILSGVIINYKTNDCIIRTGLTYLAITLWTYYVHDLMHKYPDSPLGKIHAIHHKPVYAGQLSTELLEILVNVIIIGGALWIPIISCIENYIGYRIVNHYIILVWAMVFMTYHLINYHNLRNDIHSQHHEENGENNYGPEWYDILFNTKAEHSRIEDMTSAIVNLVFFTIVILYLKDTKYDLVDAMRVKCS